MKTSVIVESLAEYQAVQKYKGKKVKVASMQITFPTVIKVDLKGGPDEMSFMEFQQWFLLNN